MKKLLVVLLALTCLSALAFADGGVTVGFDFGRSQFVAAEALTTAPLGFTTDTYQGWSPYSGTFPNVQRFDMQFAWSSQFAAINITAYMQPFSEMTSPLKTVGIPGIGVDWVNMYGTLKLMPDMFTAYVGRFEGDGWDHFRWDSAHPQHDTDNNSIGRFAGWGIILDVMPKDSGFDAAVFMKTNDPTTGGFGTIKLENQVTNYDFAASYTVPNLVTVQAGSTTFATYPFPDRNIFAGAKLLMIPNLTLFDSFWYKGFAYPTSVTIFSDELAAQYVMGPLTLVLAAYYTSDGTVTNATDSHIKVYPEVYYNLGAFTVGLYAGYDMEMVQNGTNNGSRLDIEPYIKLNDFNLRVSLHYFSVTLVNTTTTFAAGWEIPIIFDWGF